MAGVYVHIPFCRAKCHYCDFVSFPGKEALFEPYKNALLNEIRQRGALKGQRVSSVFIGGGTPTLFPLAYLDEIMDELSKFQAENNIEITVEANPGTLNKDMLQGLKHMGVNRLSIGLQAWQDSLLERLGRVHRVRAFQENYEEAVRAGFENVNVDVMFSLPGQTLAQWHETLENVTKLKPRHVSAYGLIVEAHTPFGQLREEGCLNLPDDDTDRAMYALAKKHLKQHGYEHYEISNFAQADFFSRHNVCYWVRAEYVGFGLNAHSFLNGRRFMNTADLDAYIKANGNPLAVLEEETVVVEKDAMSEFMFLGLRMIKGVDAKDFKNAFGQDMTDVFRRSIDIHVRNGLLALENGRLALTEKGIDLSNVVFSDFLL